MGGIRKWRKKYDNGIGKIRPLKSLPANSQTNPTPPEGRLKEWETPLLSDSDAHLREYDSYALGRVRDPLEPNTEYNINSEYARYEKGIGEYWSNKIDVPRENENERETQYWFEALNTIDQYWKVTVLEVDTFLNIIGQQLYNVFCGSDFFIDENVIQTNALSLVWEQIQGNRTITITIVGQPLPVRLNLESLCIPNTGCTGNPGEPIIVRVYPEGEEILFQEFVFNTTPTTFPASNIGTTFGIRILSPEEDVLPIIFSPRVWGARGAYKVDSTTEVRVRPSPPSLFDKDKWFNLFVDPESARPENPLFSEENSIRRYDWMENRFGQYEIFTGFEDLNNTITRTSQRITPTGAIRVTPTGATRITLAGTTPEQNQIFTRGLPPDPSQRRRIIPRSPLTFRITPQQKQDFRNKIVGVGVQQRITPTGKIRVTPTGAIRIRPFIGYQESGENGEILITPGRWYKVITRYSHLGKRTEKDSISSTYYLPFPSDTFSQLHGYDIGEVGVVFGGDNEYEILIVSAIFKSAQDEVPSSTLITSAENEYEILDRQAIFKGDTDSINNKDGPIIGGDNSFEIEPVGGIIVG